ncbi:hypothetical protein BTVI_88757 [Pitangus sulphuratus]|nr:hypothetical protein BTVI_88757 [Pitangus sulphuratus]
MASLGATPALGSVKDQWITYFGTPEENPVMQVGFAAGHWMGRETNGGIFQDIQHFPAMSVMMPMAKDSPNTLPPS